MKSQVMGDRHRVDRWNLGRVAFGPLGAAVLALGMLPWMAGCASGPVADRTEGAAGPADQSPVTATEHWQRLEDRLEEAEKVSFDFDLKTTGALAAALKGSAAWGADGDATVAASGLFVGQGMDLDLRSEEGRLVGGSAAGRFDEETPPALIEALSLGFTRMGILHNLARLTGGRAPDHATSGVGDWLRMEKLALGEAKEVGGEEVTAVTFELLIDGARSGVGTLWLDDEGLPVERHQTVFFPNGEMEVVEVYSNFVVKRAESN